MKSILHVLHTVDRAEITQEDRSPEGLHCLVKEVLRSVGSCPPVMGIIVDYRAMLSGLFHLAFLAKVRTDNQLDFSEQVMQLAVEYTLAHRKHMIAQVQDGFMPTVIGQTLAFGTTVATRCIGKPSIEPTCVAGQVVAMMDELADRMD